MINEQKIKMVIAGVGGQGVVYLTNLIAEAAVLSDIDVHVSEIHGLSQRGGVVTSGIGFGKNNTGFTSAAGVDFLIGLEPLETQRCLDLLHTKSSVVFGNYRTLPYSVNSGSFEYPDTEKFYRYISDQCEEVLFVAHFPEHLQTIHYNIYLLGIAVQIKKFPVSREKIVEAIENNTAGFYKDKTLKIFEEGIEKGKELKRQSNKEEKKISDT